MAVSGSHAEGDGLRYYRAEEPEFPGVRACGGLGFHRALYHVDRVPELGKVVVPGGTVRA